MHEEREKRSPTVILPRDYHKTAFRVERWRDGLGGAYLFPPLSSAGASISRPHSVSTLPLIDPEVRFSATNEKRGIRCVNGNKEEEE